MSGCKLDVQEAYVVTSNFIGPAPRTELSFTSFFLLAIFFTTVNITYKVETSME